MSLIPKFDQHPLLTTFFWGTGIVGLGLHHQVQLLAEERCMEGHEDTCWGPPPMCIKYITWKQRQIVSEGIGTAWLGNEMWFQL